MSRDFLKLNCFFKMEGIYNDLFNWNVKLFFKGALIQQKLRFISFYKLFGAFDSVGFIVDKGRAVLFDKDAVGYTLNENGSVDAVGERENIPCAYRVNKGIFAKTF